MTMSQAEPEKTVRRSRPFTLMDCGIIIVGVAVGFGALSAVQRALAEQQAGTGARVDKAALVAAGVFTVGAGLTAVALVNAKLT